MIITQLKGINEIYEMVKDYTKILIAGCDGCCQPPRSINEAKVLGQLLELKARTEGKDLKWKAITVLRQCDDRIASTTVRPFLEEYEAIVSLACGLGIVMMNQVAEKILTLDSGSDGASPESVVSFLVVAKNHLPFGFDGFSLKVETTERPGFEPEDPV